MFKQRQQKKPGSKILRAAKYLTGAAITTGVVVGGTKYLKNRKLAPSASQPQGFSNKKFQNSQKVKQRLDALGGSAAARNREGRNTNELIVIKNKQRFLGKKNAAKAQRLRAQGKYFRTRLRLTSFGR